MQELLSYFDCYTKINVATRQYLEEINKVSYAWNFIKHTGECFSNLPKYFTSHVGASLRKGKGERKSGAPDFRSPFPFLAPATQAMWEQTKTIQAQTKVGAIS